MRISRFLRSLILIGVIGAQSAIAQQAPAQPTMGAGDLNGAPTSQQVAMIMLRIEHNKGKDFIVTPKGLRAQVPGKGISSSAKAVAVYQDPQRNYWYIDKKGEPTPVRPEVVQSVMAQFGAEIQQSQTATSLASGVNGASGAIGTAGGAPVQQTTIIQQPPASGSSGGGAGAMGVASMAMSGTALGLSIGALSNSSNHSYYGVPYGKPIYQDNHHYYYNNDSKKVYVAPNSNNKEYFNQWNKQGNWNDRQTWQKSVQPVGQSARYERAGRFRR
jgi:hypothetical protein